MGEMGNEYKVLVRKKEAAQKA